MKLGWLLIISLIYFFTQFVLYQKAPIPSLCEAETKESVAFTDDDESLQPLNFQLIEGEYESMAIDDSILGGEPLVSIILPTYNGMKYIEQTINSVLAQTYKNYELIIIDDSSTDDTISYLRTLDDARIQIFSHSKNQ
ncbi:glycosyltransferase [Acrasis kona]|uniref:Glycosyltransferase n=1 Tax=Acrasis kona TaxID=1008807 RepID=A0AAW2YMC6_9EUKA